jgi:hypothetical protein
MFADRKNLAKQAETQAAVASPKRGRPPLGNLRAAGSYSIRLSTFRLMTCHPIRGWPGLIPPRLSASSAIKDTLIARARCLLPA